MTRPEPAPVTGSTRPDAVTWGKRCHRCRHQYPLPDTACPECGSREFEAIPYPHINTRAGGAGAML